MTKNELTLAIATQEFTLKRALELSIKKWTELDKHWPLFDSDHLPLSINCPLCRFFETQASVTCDDCPLYEILEEEDDHETLDCCVDYADAVNAINQHNFSRFQAAQGYIVEKLQAALRKTRHRDFEQECNDQEPQKGTGV